MKKELHKRIEVLLEKFESTSLEELEAKNLINRFEQKFFFNVDILPELIKELRENYKVLDIKGDRIFSIENFYFDTPQYKLYTDHVNGKKNRYKVRNRRYLESNIAFSEIKRKSNKRRVVKHRIPQSALSNKIGEDLKTLTSKITDINPEDLVSKLKVCYRRITLTHKIKTEKITLDTNLYFKNTVKDNALKNLAIAEVKFPDRKLVSEFTRIIKKYGIQPSSISKYCVGTALTTPKVKYNRLKPKLMLINKICNNNSGQSQDDGYRII